MRTLDIIRAQLYLSYYWLKNNKAMAFMMLLWPYLLVGIMMGLGYLIGDPRLYSSRMNIESPFLYLLSASVIAMGSIGIIDSVASFTLSNRWIGTIQYILLSPIKREKIFLASGIPDSILNITIMVGSVSPAILLIGGLSQIPSIITVYVFMIFGMLPLLGLSVLASSILLIVKEESNIINSLVPFILLVSGIFYPIHILPNILQFFSKIIPVTYVIEAARMSASLSQSIPQLYYIIYILTLLTFGYNILAVLGLNKINELLGRKGVD